MSLASALGSPAALQAATGNGHGTAAFELGTVRLLPGPFEAARARDARYMLSLDADRMLHNFRVNAGLPPRALVYGGWLGVGGALGRHPLPWPHAGHYLSACAMMAASGGEPEFRRRVDYIVAELQACQQASGSGLVSAFPDDDAQLRVGQDHGDLLHAQHAAAQAWW